MPAESACPFQPLTPTDCLAGDSPACCTVAVAYSVQVAAAGSKGQCAQPQAWSQAPSSHLGRYQGLSVSQLAGYGLDLVALDLAQCLANLQQIVMGLLAGVLSSSKHQQLVTPDSLQQKCPAISTQVR